MPDRIPSLTPAGVIIPAGGIGSRFGHRQPKQFLPLAGQPVLVHTCKAFLTIETIHAIVVVTPAEYHQATQDLLGAYLSREEIACLRFTVGGITRQDSVAAGLQALPGEISLVMVHDAARPLVDRDLIMRCLAGADQYGAVIAAVPVKDTIKKATSSGTVTQTVDRTALWQAQTPQGGRRALLEQAFSLARREGFLGTDEASLLEFAGIPVHIIEGSDRNLKITRPEDLPIATALLQHTTIMKIGHGFDAHRLVSGRKLILGGVTVDFPLGLDGHSDADVVTHALIDALLGAMSAGDIGSHFPDSDPRYRGISSLLLLEEVIQSADSRELRLGNADLTIVCQSPKLAPHIEVMRANLARCCKVSSAAINIKATTTEKMGYTGRGEGIAAHAVVLMRSI